MRVQILHLALVDRCRAEVARRAHSSEVAGSTPAIGNERHDDALEEKRRKLIKSGYIFPEVKTIVNCR